MKKATPTKVAAAVRAQIGRRGLIAATLAAGGALASAPIAALELGDVQVSSYLGQPLRANIAYRLGPNEFLAASCISLQRGTTVGGLPNVSRAEISVADGVISVVGATAVREPLMMMRVNIRCAYTPQLTRDYMVFIDPARSVATADGVAPAATPIPTRTTVAAEPTPAPVERRRVVNRDPISSSTRYRVQPGDSLSVIAQRVEDRPIGIWDAAARIFDANPEAFINDDPNRLKAGVWLDIPDFRIQAASTTEILPVSPESAPAEPASTAVDATGQPAESAAQTVPAESAIIADPRAAAPGEPTAADSEEFVGRGTAPDSAVQPVAEEADSPTLETGGVVVESSRPELNRGIESTPIPDTELPGPETRSTTPGVTTATPVPRSPEAESSGWIGWLLGAAVALIGGLWLLRQRFWPASGRTPTEPVEIPRPRERDAITRRLETLVAADVAVDDEPPTEENVALDADLSMGTGLTDGTTVDPTQDVGPATATKIDFELPEEPSVENVSLSATDILPPLQAETGSILESEVLPGEDEDDDESDMSVVIDATGIREAEDSTEYLIAPPQSDGDAESFDDLDLTVEQQSELKILEQDYEDELTATQALSKEVERAAAELAERFGEGGDEVPDSDTSSTMIAALDVTAQLPARDGDATAQLPARGENEPDEDEDFDMDEAVTVILSCDDATDEMLAPEDDGDTAETLIEEDDATAEMPIRRR